MSGTGTNSSERWKCQLAVVPSARMALGWQCEWAYAGLLQEAAPFTDFYDIHELKRCELLTEVLRRFSQADVENGELALTEDRTPEQIWAEICRAKNTELCSIPDRVMRGF